MISSEAKLRALLTGKVGDTMAKKAAKRGKTLAKKNLSGKAMKRVKGGASAGDSQATTSVGQGLASQKLIKW